MITNKDLVDIRTKLKRDVYDLLDPHPDLVCVLVDNAFKELGAKLDTASINSSTLGAKRVCSKCGSDKLFYHSFQANLVYCVCGNVDDINSKVVQTRVRPEVFYMIKRALETLGMCKPLELLAHFEEYLQVGEYGIVKEFLQYHYDNDISIGSNIEKSFNYYLLLAGDGYESNQ